MTIPEMDPAMSLETHASPLPGTPEYDAEPVLEHQFDDLEQQQLSSTLAMWAFLATEVMFFGGLIAAFFVYRSLYHAEFVAAAQHLSVMWGGINTIVLLTSSLTMALAVRASQLRRPKQAVYLMLATMVLGTAFLGIKAIEWTHDYHAKLMPGVSFVWHEKGHGGHDEGGDDGGGDHSITETPIDVAPVQVPNRAGLPGLVGPESDLDYTLEQSRSDTGHRAAMFFVLYFFMTGLHGIHMIVGIALVGTMAWLTWRGWLSGCGSTQIEVTGLYWHFVDIVWVYLYPLLYLIDLHL
jgi:cytochrome c oxidase subunit 3